MSFVHANGRDTAEMEVCTLMKVLIGIDAHKVSERREDLGGERTLALKAACTGSCGTSSPAG